MYSILYHPDVTALDIPGLNRDIRKRLKTAIENRLGQGPDLYGKPLRGEMKSLWSLRVGDYRVLYKLEGRTVTVIRIANRRDAYADGRVEARRRGLI